MIQWKFHYVGDKNDSVLDWQNRMRITVKYLDLLRKISRVDLVKLLGHFLTDSFVDFFLENGAR